MTRLRALLGAVLLAVACAGPAAAQPEIGSLINRNRGAVDHLEIVDRANSAQVMIAFARCFARRGERGAAAVLAMPYMSAEQETAALRIVNRTDGCLGDNGVELRFPTQLLVGGMAEHFILRVYNEVEISRLVAMDDEAVTRAGLLGRNSYEMLSLCVVRRDPAAARALIGTPADTDAERAVINRIVPHLAPCIPADFQMRFNRGALRALIATGVYRVLGRLGSAA